MKPVYDTIQRTGDLGGDKIGLSLDENSLTHLMDLLTNLYSDPAMAVIREYSTNAWDSHVEAGTDAPIEITTPTALSPTFVVKDRGVGLSIDDVANVYSKYGASTKRDTNDQVGMLGLGCKSALTYTPQFTVVAVKNGIRSIVSISRENDGGGFMEVVDTSSTYADNGVEVRIPVKTNVGEFNQKIKSFFRFWKPGRVLIDGKPAEVLGGRRIGKFLVTDNLGADYVVMGNVGYRIECSHSLFVCSTNRFGYYGKTFSVVADVNIGDVNFTPSREDLHYTPTTEKTLSLLREEFKREYAQYITDDIARATSKSNALTRYEGWNALLGANVLSALDVKYKGEDIPLNFRVNGYRFHLHRDSYNTESIDGIGVNQIRSATVIHGHTKANLTSTDRAKIRRWAEENNINDNSVWIFETRPGGDWLADQTMYDWADVAKIVTPQRKASGGLRFEVLENGRWKGTDEIDDSKDIVFFSPSDVDKNEVLNHLGSIQDATIVKLGKNRWDKFRRDFPDAQKLGAWLREKAAENIDNLSYDDKIAATLSKSGLSLKSFYSSFIGSKIDDPDFKKFVEIVENYDFTKLDRATRLDRALRAIYGAHKGIDIPVVEAPHQKYILFGQYVYGVDEYRVKHYTCYINAAYKENLV